MACVMFFSVHISLLLLQFVVSEDEKRILISDPAYIQQQMVNLQSEVQLLQTKFDSQESTIRQLQSQITSLETTNKQVTTQSGALFTRWGRQECPSNETNTLVYSGFTSGSNAGHAGAAADFICLPNDPVYGPNKEHTYAYYGMLYGVEYEDASLYGMPNAQEDAPCSVCLGSTHETSLMIPGRTQCYPGWTEAYRGILSSGDYRSTGANQFICVDLHPEAMPGGGTINDGGRLLYGVKATCG